MIFPSTSQDPSGQNFSVALLEKKEVLDGKELLDVLMNQWQRAVVREGGKRQGREGRQRGEGRQRRESEGG